MLTRKAKWDINGYGTLLYDPASHAYGGNGDMGVMIVPTNEAMQEYWTSEEGKFLSTNFHSGTVCTRLWFLLFAESSTAFVQRCIAA